MGRKARSRAARMAATGDSGAGASAHEPVLTAAKGGGGGDSNDDDVRSSDGGGSELSATPKRTMGDEIFALSDDVATTMTTMRLRMLVPLAREARRRGVPGQQTMRHQRRRQGSRSASRLSKLLLRLMLRKTMVVVAML